MQIKRSGLVVIPIGNQAKPAVMMNSLHLRRGMLGAGTPAATVDMEVTNSNNIERERKLKGGERLI